MTRISVEYLDSAFAPQVRRYKSGCSWEPQDGGVIIFNEFGNRVAYYSSRHLVRVYVSKEAEE